MSNEDKIEVQDFSFNQALGFGQTKLFLVLQQADTDEVVEVVVEAQKAHTTNVSRLIHADGVDKVSFQVAEGNYRLNLIIKVRSAFF
jgi:hypothetical protein